MTTRRKIASSLLLIGALFVGAKLLGASDKLVPATLVYRLPAGATRLDAEVGPPGGDAVLARFVVALVPAQAEAQQKTRLPPGTHEVRVSLATPAGEQLSTRTVEISRDAVVTLDLR